MKATATIIALVGLVVPAVMAQFPADFPACGVRTPSPLPVPDPQHRGWTDT